MDRRGVKLIEPELRATAALYREIFDDGPSALWVEDWSAVGHAVDRLIQDGVSEWRAYFADHPEFVAHAYNMVVSLECSNANLKIYGAQSKEVLLSKSSAQEVLPTELSCFADILIAMIEGHTDGVFESIDDRVDGTPFLVRTRFVIPPAYRSDWARVLYSLEDITEQRAADLALRASEERLQQATELAGLGHCIWDAVEDQCLYCSEEYARLHGLNVEAYMERAATIDRPFSMVHPEDRDKIGELYKRLRDGEPFECEYRTLSPTGEIRFVHEIAKPIRDSQSTLR